MESLRAGPVMMVRGMALIPVTKVAVGTLGPTVCGSATPVAVVIVTGGVSVTWTMDGHAEPTGRWLEAVPELERLIAGAVELGGP